MMFKFAKARPQVLNDLDEYLQLISDEPVLWLEREIRSWNEFSYDELATLIASGDVELISWQQRYAHVVNEKFNPLWLAAIQAGSFASTRGRITIDDSDVRVKEFLRTRGAEFVTQLSDESKRAVANVILFGQSENLKPVDIAKLIRPLIGLNAPQAQANLNYRARVLSKLIDAGLSPAQAAIRADKSAAAYAVKQHKYRAETIVHTELARAYNQGAFDGVRAAVDAKLMPHCEMIWSTAGTNRVCSRCLDLKDVVVGRTDEVGVQIPPLHPRCRCVIIYRESSKSTRGGRGLAAGNANITTANGNPPKLIDKIEVVTSATIQKTLEYYEAQIVQAPVEHAVIVTKTGEIYHCSGDVHDIPIRYFKQLATRLEGAHVTHNHPPDAVENEHTFSDDDFKLFKNFGFARLLGVDEKFIYELNRNPLDNELASHDLVEIYNLGLNFEDYHTAIMLKALNEGFGYWRRER